jgi:peroxiredoxin
VSDRDLASVPPDLPIPTDDGAAAHLVGQRVAGVVLPATDRRQVRLDKLATARAVVYAYPRMGRPGEALPTPDWDLIPGARGCTPEACSFRDHHSDLLGLGVEVYGLSTQDTDYQREVVDRLHLPFVLLSDAQLELTRSMNLPTFEVGGQRLLRRLTLVIHEGSIEHVWYPVFPPDAHAKEVLAWLQANPLS